MKTVLVAVLLVAVILLLAGWFIRPSNNRRWLAGQEVLPWSTFSGHSVTIQNVRNFTYNSDGTPAQARYEDRTYDLDKLTSVWFVVSPFSRERRGPAHTFLSFGFSDSEYVAISVEARREVGEDYSVLKGLLRRFEIMYVVGDERDLIGLRANVRNDDVYVYPVKTGADKARAVFVQMLKRANRLREKPEFYNTITNNCTTNILKHANAVSPTKIPYGREVLLPGYADELAEKLGLIDSELPIEKARLRFRVNERAHRYATDPDFSTKIRNVL
jgi:hypothetical protein